MSERKVEPLTPEEERELLADFWENKSELVRVLVRHFPKLRAIKPTLEISREHVYRSADGKPVFKKIKYKPNAAKCC